MTKQEKIALLYYLMKTIDLEKTDMITNIHLINNEGKSEKIEFNESLLPYIPHDAKSIVIKFF